MDRAARKRLASRPMTVHEAIVNPAGTGPVGDFSRPTSEMKSAQHHHAAKVVQTGRSVEQPYQVEVGEGALNPPGEAAKLVSRQMHEFGDRQKLHVLLHRLTAPTAVFGEAVAPEKADASSDRTRRSAQHLHR